MFSVCVLLYGDHPGLARRCLGSLGAALDPEWVDEVRIGLNQPGDASRAILDSLQRTSPVPVVTYEEVERRNVGKYPLMRRMFREPRPISSPYTMWWDDDSYLKSWDPCWPSPRPTPATESWWARVAGALAGVDMVGAVYQLGSGLIGNQREAIWHQPWYTGEPLILGYRPKFCTGGWWTIRTAILHEWDYPFPDLYHTGGDYLLGELFRQQGYTMKNFRDGVAINADVGGHESKSPRRGPIPRQHPWQRWSKTVPADLSHHRFEIAIQH